MNSKKANALLMRFTLNSDDPTKQIVVKENLNEITGKELIDLGVDLPNKYNHTVCLKINIFPNSGENKAGNIRIIEEFPLLIQTSKNGIFREDRVCKATLLSITDFLVTRIKILNTKYHNSFLFFEKYVPLQVKLAQTIKPEKKPITNIEQHSQLKLVLNTNVINQEIERLEAMNDESKAVKEATKIKKGLIVPETKTNSEDRLKDEKDARFVTNTYSLLKEQNSSISDANNIKSNFLPKEEIKSIKNPNNEDYLEQLKRKLISNSNSQKKEENIATLKKDTLNPNPTNPDEYNQGSEFINPITDPDKKKLDDYFYYNDIGGNAEEKNQNLMRIIIFSKE